MRKTLATLLVFTLILTAAGCGMFGGGRSIVTYQQGTIPFSTQVYEEGTYGLFARDEDDPRYTVQLRPGDRLGFRQAEGGSHLYAVAGSQEIPLFPNQTYFWKKM